MNKGQLLDKIADGTGIRKATARALDSLIGAVSSELTQGGNVTLLGFSTFKYQLVLFLKAITHKPRQVYKFPLQHPLLKAGKALKQPCNKISE